MRCVSAAEAGSFDLAVYFGVRERGMNVVAFGGQASVVAFAQAMTVLACLTHWYTSAMFVVPVAAVGGWSWRGSRRGGQGGEDQGPPAQL